MKWDVSLKIFPWVNKKENNKEEEYYRMLRLKAVKKAIIITKQLNMRLH